MSSGFWGDAPDREANPHDESLGDLEIVHLFEDGPMPTGVTVSSAGRIFVNFPKWGDDVPATVVELRDGDAVPYPSVGANSPKGDDDPDAFVSVQSVVIDPAGWLWVLDTGSPMFQLTRTGGPKLVRIDLDTDEVVQTIVLESEVALPTTYLNDIRFDLDRGEAGAAFITDSAQAGPNGIIVVDLATGEAWRRLHDHPSTKAVGVDEVVPMVEGRVFAQRPADGAPRQVSMGADGIAISADAERLWYCPLISRRWYSVSVEALWNREVSDAEVAKTVVDEGDKGGIADGLQTDSEGRFYATNPEQNAIVRRSPSGELETIVHDPRLLWPDTMSIGADGYLYVTSGQLHRQADYQGGVDLRVYPYHLFRVALRAGRDEA